MMLRIKKKNIPTMSVWEQIVQFQFIENEKNMWWKEKFFITSVSEEEAQELSKKFIKKKKEDNKSLENFDVSIIENLHLSENQSTSSGHSIHGQIIDINIQ